MTPLRILYVDTEKVWRGGQEQLFSLMVGMRERGHEVSLAAPAEGPLAARAIDLGIIHRPFLQRSEFSSTAFWRLFQIMRGIPLDVVHFNTPRSILAGGLASKLNHVPVRICSRRVNFPLRSLLSRYKYNFMLESVVTVSESIRDTLIEDGVDSKMIDVIYEGVDLEWIDGLEPAPLSFGKDRLVVGMVAHLSPEKGHHTLLEAAAMVALQLPLVVFVVVGEGELRAQLEQLSSRLGIADRVTFTGFRTDSEALTRELDVFCLPSLSEGLSSAILAAMASQVPVVATSVGGIPELVVHTETGFLVPPNDPESLAAALLEILSSEGLRQQLGKAGRTRVEQYFTLAGKLDRTERLYRGLLSKRSIV